MPIAKEGWREILLATIVLGGLAVGAAMLWWPVAIVPGVLWIWVLAFFRDPPRRRDYLPGDLCAPCDGTVTEIAELEHHPSLGGPAVRIGMFLSLFNVHVNRAPCSGVVRQTTYNEGEFLDARHPESGTRNESNTLLIEPEPAMPGPIVVRQVAGLVARRIICHAGAGDSLAIGQRFGIIKFGSRTELIIPRFDTTEILVSVGDPVRGGLTILARQDVSGSAAKPEKTAAEAALAKG